ncbi:unnamed protein product [Sphagnum troendelagicum]|uniref:BHLH domain-containing protein n=1 Tax=Sphagnum troendelagicum TaxID=128251 RepID=A0ABP0UU15_9BRYO
METQRTPEMPDQDSLEVACMENGDVENRSFEMQCVSAESCNIHPVGVLEEDDVSQSPRMERTAANQDSLPFIEFENDRIGENIQYLQKLVSNSNQTDKASVVDDAINYIKFLQLQLKILSIRSGVNLPSVSHLQMPRMPQMAMNMGVGTGMGLGMGMVDMGATGSGHGLTPVTSATGPAVPHNMSVPGTMMEAHDPHMDPHNSYLAHQDQAMQIQQVSSSIQNTRSPVL